MVSRTREVAAFGECEGVDGRGGGWRWLGLLFGRVRLKMGLFGE